MHELTDFLGPTLAGAPGRVLAGIWGALWGSFFNVMIVRVPAGESLVRPSSHCRACGAKVAWYDNLPLLSYLLLRGRCRRCGARFSARYLLVELLLAGLTLIMHQVFLVDGSGELGLRVAQLVTSSLFCGLLVAVTFIDLDSFRIPDAITYPAIPTAMLLSLFMGHPHLWDGPVGGVAGYLVIRLLADGYQLITGRIGMGYGDAKLLAVIGGLLGWQTLLPTLFLAAFQGSVIGISVLVILRNRRGAASEPTAVDAPGEARSTEAPSSEAQPTDGTGPATEAAASEEEAPSASLRHARIPFGPFLSLAAVEILALRKQLAAFFPFLG
jgi:leader peptidase (prepilin peptidase)/N-methyltransferase